MLVPPPEGWRPLLRGIPDPPLKKLTRVLRPPFPQNNVWPGHLWLYETVLIRITCGMGSNHNQLVKTLDYQA